MRQSMKAIPLATLLIALAACTASGSKTSSGAAKAPPEAVAPIAGAATASASSGGGGSAAGAPVLVNRSVVVNASITVRTDDIGQAVHAVESLAGKKGGVVYDEQVDLTPKESGKPGNAAATVTLKVPPDTLDETLDAIGNLGTEVSRSRSSEDVTSKVVDVKARIDAAQASIARLTELMNHTGSVPDLLNVESQLSQRDSDLESLEQQRDSLKSQTSAATVTAHLEATPPVAAVVHAKHTPGFLRGLRGGWNAFAATATAVFTAICAALPFLAIVGVLVAAFFIGRRKLRARRPQEL